jgi:cell shape-determining protein MreC
MNLNDAPRRIRWVTVAFLLGIAILLSILDATGNMDVAFSVLRDPFTAVLNLTSGSADTVAGALAGPRDLETARAEIALLQSQVDDLERENEELREIQGEYQLLLDLFNRARQSPRIHPPDRLRDRP